MCRPITMIITVSLVFALSRCGAQTPYANQSDDFRDWETAKLFAHGASLLKKGVQLNEAIAVLSMSVRRDGGRYDYQLALGSASASRFASIACTSGQATAQSRSHLQYEKQAAEWDIARKDPANPDFGIPRPEEPPPPSTPDDGKRFVMRKDETRQALLKLGRQSIAAYDEARRLAEHASTEERRAVEYERGWGLYLLWRFGRELVPDEPRTNQATLKKEDVLSVRRSDVIDCFTRCTLLDPKSGESWHSLGLAYVPKTIFAVEFDSVRKYMDGTAINSMKDDTDALAALNRALALKPKDFNLLYQSAQVCGEVDPALALSYLDRAAQHMPTNALLWYFLAGLRFKSAPSRNEKDAMDINLSALQDVQTGNSASQYWAVPIVIPAPPMLKRAWEYTTVYGLTEDPIIIQETMFPLREFAVDRDEHGDVDRFMNVIPAIMTMGLKVIAGIDRQDLDYKDSRARTIRWARVFTGTICSEMAYDLVRRSQGVRPDDRKEAYIEDQKDLFHKLQALEKEVLKPNSALR